MARTANKDRWIGCDICKVKKPTLGFEHFGERIYVCSQCLKSVYKYRGSVTTDREGKEGNGQ